MRGVGYSELEREREERDLACEEKKRVRGVARRSGGEGTGGRSESRAGSKAEEKRRKKRGGNRTEEGDVMKELNGVEVGSGCKGWPG